MSTMIEEPGTKVTQREPAKAVILFSVTPATIEGMTEKCLAMKINGVADTGNREIVRKLLKECVAARKAIDAEHKAAKEDALAECQRLDKLKRDMYALIAIPEKHLEAQIDAVTAELAKIEKQKADAAYEIRLQQLINAGGSLPESVVRAMNEHEFAEEVARTSERTRIKREEELRQAEEKEQLRIEAEKLAADRAEFDRQRAEQEAEAARLRKIEDDRNAAERAELDRQRQEQQAEAARLRKIESDRIAAEQAEARRKADDEAVKQRQVEMARLEHEATEKARIEAELRIKREAEQAESDRKQAEADRLREEAMRPDQEKLLALAIQLEAIAMPTVSEQSAELLRKVEAIINQAAFDIRTAVKPPKKARGAK